MVWKIEGPNPVGNFGNNLSKYLMFLSTSLTHCFAVLLKIVNGIWCKRTEKADWFSLMAQARLSQAGTREEVVKMY